MDKHQFNAFILHFPSSTSEEAKEVYALCQHYPYSQLLHTVTARLGADNKWTNQQQLLQEAAIYSTDRSVLKAMLELPLIKSGLASPSTETVVQADSESHNYAEEVLHDLEQLKASRLSFERQFADDVPVDNSAVAVEPEQLQLVPPDTNQSDGSEIKDNTEAEYKEDETSSSRSSSRRQRLIELARELSTKSVDETGQREKPGLDPLIEELQSKHHEKTPANDKTREQIELIEKYIQSSPSRRTPKPEPQEKEDLSSGVKTGVFGEHIVSETLADILIRQGKREKAIDVFRKLIWKFPQKKAYFAARIEELTK